jgi:hypothetical protein
MSVQAITHSFTVWTPERVAELMVAAFRDLPGTAVYSSRGKVYPLGALPPGPTKVINWTDRYLPPDRRKILLLWASSLARGESEGSIRAKASAMGMPLSTFYRHKDSACDAIAAGLHRDRINLF